MSLLRKLVNPLGNIHRQGVLPDIFIFSVPRTGSTFLMELLSAQPGMKVHNEPFSMNFPNVRRELGVDNWRDATIMPNREEVYRRYVEDRRSGRINDMVIPFWSQGGRFFTTRNTFKILHAAEDMIPWFEETFDAAIVLLIRHPIPTVQSHAKHPRLDYFLQQPGMRDRLAPEHLSFAETVLKSDDAFARGVLDWCLQYYPAFANGVSDRWTVISYEDLAVNADAAVAYLTKRLCLAPTDNLQELINQPSKSTVQSDSETVAFFESEEGQSDRRYLIAKWRQRVDEAQEKRTFEILNGMGLDIYSSGDLFPVEKYRVPGAPVND